MPSVSRCRIRTTARLESNGCKEPESDVAMWSIQKKKKKLVLQMVPNETKNNDSCPGAN